MLDKTLRCIDLFESNSPFPFQFQCQRVISKSPTHTYYGCRFVPARFPDVFIVVSAGWPIRAAPPHPRTADETREASVRELPAFSPLKCGLANTTYVPSFTAASNKLLRALRKTTRKNMRCFFVSIPATVSHCASLILTGAVAILVSHQKCCFRYN